MHSFCVCIYDSFMRTVVLQNTTFRFSVCPHMYRNDNKDFKLDLKRKHRYTDTRAFEIRSADRRSFQTFKCVLSICVCALLSNEHNGHSDAFKNELNSAQMLTVNKPDQLVVKTLKRAIIKEIRVPCNQDWWPLVVPTHRPSLHHSHQASWHQDQERSQVCPIPTKTQRLY